MKKFTPLAIIGAMLTFFLLSYSQSWAATVAAKSRACPKAEFLDLSKSVGAGGHLSFK
jgi:hypothetical protein